ncbi:uncharacterized protein Z520_12379 [Fonsecaea multimorphosa CBS 102226]|uniref:Velvet domain-containing protein n=1 Tax=Fonsecaea multimorphosa CBS 102226 TaxID=1442371 RepID=A0A0D2I3Q9_9EURO|nr:uncharacterized protein Z520_12379 [Fonsecaea multimorphosa CBS 102226]KIX91916.1 hypothetical protein Z520_12379 [Fonsecaea multimorphosa CBS 102226]OAL19187.1 hypothetical protein AYO22_09948 [Fonsecaea multimorphosa]
MELAVAPPSRVAAGVTLRTPLVVTFSGRPPRADDKREDGEAFTLPDLSGIWVFLSLTTPDMQESLAPPREDLLCGSRADSVHAICEEQEVERPTVAYATFPGLKITQPGSYRIKVNIIDMNAAFRADSSFEGAATVLPCLHSPVFEVVEASDHSGSGPQLAETVSRLRSIGVNFGGEEDH